MNFFQQSFGASKKTDLKDIIENGAFLVDVRTSVEFAGGHVTGSVNIPLHTIPAQLSKFQNRETIVVFCLSGGRSSQAKSILEQNGFTNVVNGGPWGYVNQFVK